MTRGAVPIHKACHRSKVTNGSTTIAGTDGRSTWARRLRDLMVSHIEDLGGDGAVSEAERSIVRRVATLTVELERMEAAFATAGHATAAELDLYSRCAGNLRRLLEAIGIQRRPADKTPTLRDYIAGKSRAVA